MKTKNIQRMTAEIDQHRAADLLVQGDYYDSSTGRGCFIGCLTHGNDTAVIADRFGVPEPLTRLLKSIFERLPFDEAADFFTDIPRAIGEDGKDLTRVHWAFLGDMLRHLPDTDARDVVTDVIVGMDLLAAGQDWPGASEAARAAVRAGETWSAKAAYRAAARVAQAAAWSAYWAAKAKAEAEAEVAEEAAWSAEVAEEAAWSARVAQAAAWSAYWAAKAARAARAAGAVAGAEETRRQRDVILRLIREA